MAHDSKLTLISDDLPQRDASRGTPKELQDDRISAHGGTPISSGEKEQELHTIEESRRETNRKWSMPLEENLTTPSKRDVSFMKSPGICIPVLVIPAPSLQTVSSDELIPSLEKESDSEESLEKVLGQTTASILNEAEAEAASLVNEEAGHTASEEEDSPDKLHSLLNCRICQLFVRTVDRLLDKSEEMMDHYMPLTEEEIRNLKLAVEELDASPADHQKSACLDRITALSSRLRQRAYMMALGKLRLARRSTHSNLSQLQQTLDLIEHAQQEAEPEVRESHEKLNEICSRWNQERQSAGELPPYHRDEVLPTSGGWIEAGAPLPGDGSPVEVEVPRDGPPKEAGISPLAARRSVPGSREEKSSPSTEVEFKTLEMSRTLTLDLQGTYESLLANLKDLPLNLKGKLYRTYRDLAELHAKFTTAHSFADLPSGILEKSLQFMAQAQESMDEVMEFAFQNPMGMLAEDHPPVPVPVPTEKPSAQQEETDILKIQAAYDPKGCDENTE